MRKRRYMKAEFTVEAAGVMAAVMFTVFVLLRAALLLRAETVDIMGHHREVEIERHAIENKKESHITRQTSGPGWSLDLTAPVFRPESSLRMWSLMEAKP